MEAWAKEFLEYSKLEDKRCEWVPGNKWRKASLVYKRFGVTIELMKVKKDFRMSIYGGSGTLTFRVFKESLKEDFESLKLMLQDAQAYISDMLRSIS